MCDNFCHWADNLWMFSLEKEFFDINVLEFIDK